MVIRSGFDEKVYISMWEETREGLRMTNRPMCCTSRLLRILRRATWIIVVVVRSVS